MSDGPMVFVGIDNGLKGALCAISHSGKIIDKAPMPTIEFDNKGECDEIGVLKFLHDLYNRPEQIIVGIEEPLRHAKSSQAVRSMALGFGKIIGAMGAKGIPFRRMVIKDWQRALLGKNLAKGQTKKLALEKANALWPDECWLATGRSRTPHDGLVDSALIAVHLRDMVATENHE